MHYDYEHREKRDLARVPAVMPEPDPSLLWMMERYLTTRGLSNQVARHNHWYPSRSAGDRNRRIVIPATNGQGLAYWQGRLMVGDADAKRYTSPPVPRGDSVVVVWPEKPTLSLITIVEGPMDALAAAEVGAVGVALMGNAPTVEAFQTIAKTFAGASILLVPDMDSIDAGAQWMQLLASHGCASRIAVPAPFNDLAAAPAGLRRNFLFPVPSDGVSAPKQDGTR